MMNISKKSIFVLCGVLLFSLAYSFFYAVSADAAFGPPPTCAGGDGCVSIAVCGGPTPFGIDPDCDPSTCSIAGSGGLIPCGKSCDDPDTAWIETKTCNLCSLFLMGQLLIEFMVKMSGAAAVIAIAIGGFLYVFAAGNSSSLEKAKSMIKYTLLGFVIIFIAWAIVDSILTTAGYIDPVGGKWYSIECST